MYRKLIAFLSRIFKFKDTKEARVPSEVEKLNTKLVKLFQQEDEFVVSLNGEWGVGKTHFWNDFVEENLKKQTVAYVSLFGKESIKEILTSIMVQVSTHAKRAEEANEVFRSSKLLGIDLAAVFSIGKPRDFSDVIVCFDDFERTSKKLDDKDILGLISELKEQKKCKVVMIYNQEIKSANFSTYKDKIIDYELHYKPTPAESFSHIKHKLKLFDQYPLEYFERKGITNIRVMKRAVNALNDFAFIESYVKDFPDFEQDVVNSILRFSVVNAKYQTFDFEKLIEYVSSKRFNDKGSEFSIDDDYEDMLYLFDVESPGWLHADELTNNINIYIKSSVADEIHLIRITEEWKQQKDRADITKSVQMLYLKFSYDLKYDIKVYAEEMYSLIEKHKDSIVAILSIQGFIEYINELCTVDNINEEKYHAFGLESIQKFLTNYLKTESLKSLNTFGVLNNIYRFDEGLEDYIKDIKVSLDKEEIASKEKIINMMYSPIKNGGWGDEPKLLSLVDEGTYKQYIEEDSEFLKQVLGFIQWTNRFSGGSGFETVVNKLIAVLNDIANDGDESVQFKIKRIFKELNIDVEAKNLETIK
jgi:hypothetical protein